MPTRVLLDSPTHSHGSIQAELIKNMLADHEIEADVGCEYQAGLTGALEIQTIGRRTIGCTRIPLGQCRRQINRSKTLLGIRFMSQSSVSQHRISISQFRSDLFRIVPHSFLVVKISLPNWARETFLTH